MTSTAPSLTVIRDIYTKMLLMRIVGDYARNLYEWGYIQSVATCHGHEAAQVGSAVCIEVGNDFTLPYYRDLGVVLTIGMTPYEVFRTYLQTHQQHSSTTESEDGCKSETLSTQHWGYHKHNTITGPTPVATQLLHAAGIAFASKLRKALAITIAYCGDETATEPDFLESLRFATQHKLPALFICEHDCHPSTSKPFSAPSCTQSLSLPPDLIHHQIDGTNVVAVYTAMQTAIQHARTGHGPTLLEIHVTRPLPDLHMRQTEDGTITIQNTITPPETLQHDDPLVQCQRYLEEQDAWNDTWATQLSARITTEVEQALQDALRDTLQMTQ
jgi:2-oxoisovalerate dehydrogenase E1 component alpha subunit